MKYFIGIIFCVLYTLNLHAQNVVAEVEFGKTSIEEAKPKLTYKFGKPVFDGDEILIFKNVTYNGFYFDRVLFFFQRSTNGNVLNKCWFVRNLHTASEAKELREKILDKIKEKYEFTSKINSQGFKDYYVGKSPTDSNEPYFRICANKYSAREYSVSIEYGPFEYINENF